MITRQAVEVSDSNLDHVDLMLTRGWGLSGAVHIEGRSISGFGSMQVTLTPRIARLLFGDTPSDWVGRDGTFVLRNIYPADYDIQVDHLPEDYFLKSARLGGFDVLGPGLRLEGHRGSNRLDLLISPNGAIVD